MKSATRAGWIERPLSEASIILDHLRSPLSARERSGRRGPYPYCGANGVLDHIDDFMVDDDVILLAEDGGNFDQYRTRPIAYRMTGKIWVNNHAHILKPAKGSDTGFLFYALQHKDITPYISSSTRSKLTRAELVRIKLAMPEQLEHQRAIAEVLRDVDDLIATLERLIVKKQAVKQGTMQQLLTSRVRLNGFSSSWARRRIEDLLIPRIERYMGAGVHEAPEVLSCTKHEGFVRSLEYFKNQVFSRNLAGYRIIRRGDIGYPANHVEEGSIGVQEAFDVALVSPIYVVMQPRTSIDTYFLQRQLKLESFRQEFARITNASVNRRGSLRWPQFSQIEVGLPDKEEQHAISRVIRDMETEIQTLERRLVKTKAMKQGLMQQLITGETRLPVKGAA